MRLIDADVLKQHIDKLPALPDGNFAGNHSALKALINMQPTIEEHKTGKWMTSYLDHEAMGIRPKILYCSECFQCIAYPTSYCPNCGARMEVEHDGIQD